MHVILFAGGTVNAGTAVEQALASGELVIAADSGALRALEHGQVPAFVVGDLDSLSPATLKQLEAQGTRVLAVQEEKDETDTELAIEQALQQGATRITILGALGGDRFEHTFANLLLLTAYEHTHLEIADGNSHGWLLRGPGTTHIAGQPGDLLSIFPLMASAEGVRTEDLYYPLREETLRFGRPRGISNVLLTTHATVSLRQGLLLIIHTAQAKPENHA
ncbi:MAG TPA: thiamine diphosphokinase, partial [Ktedonobacteraceae bacterium]